MSSTSATQQTGSTKAKVIVALIGLAMLAVFAIGVYLR